MVWQDRKCVIHIFRRLAAGVPRKGVGVADEELDRGAIAKRGRGRPKGTATKSVVLFVRVTEAEREAFKRAASDADLKASVLLRRFVRETGQRGVADLFPSDAPALREATSALSAVGRNLNQIAKAVNRGSAVIDAETGEDLRETLTAVRRLREAMREVLRRARTRSQAFTRPIPGMDPRP